MEPVNQRGNSTLGMVLMLLLLGSLTLHAARTQLAQGMVLVGSSDSDYYGYRLRNGQLEMQRGVDNCHAGGWERITDPAFMSIETFRLERQGQRLILLLAGRAGNQHVQQERWVEGWNLGTRAVIAHWVWC